MSDEKKGLLEAIKLGREVKEAVPSGSEYTRSKSAAQFYKGVLKDLNAREEETERRLEKLKDSPRNFEIREDEVVIPFRGDMQALMDDIDILQELMNSSWQLVAIRKGKDQVRELMGWEENHANKIGIDEVRKRLLENDMLTAAALQERSG